MFLLVAAIFRVSGRKKTWDPGDDQPHRAVAIPKPSKPPERPMSWKDPRCVPYQCLIAWMKTGNNAMWGPRLIAKLVYNSNANSYGLWYLLL